MKVLVTGSYGQLGQEIKSLSSVFPQIQFVFFDRDDLDIVQPGAIEDAFKSEEFDACINCAAYTGVDTAEAEADLAYAVNKTGAGNLSGVCKANDVRLIHISTDFVFDGRQAIPYKESDQPNPIGVYGQSKYEGEQVITTKNPEAIIIRTSWLFSSFGKNFVKTIAKLSSERDALGVVYDQVGTPTYAADLAEVILKLLNKTRPEWNPGIYHYSNEGVASWYDLAVAIVDFAGTDCKVKAIETWQYPTPALRAPYTVLHKQKIKDYLGIDIPYWRDSLNKCMLKLNENN